VSAQLAGGQDLPTLFAKWFGGERRTMVIVATVIVAGALLVFTLAKREFRQFDSLLGGIVVGLVIVGGWYVSGKLGYVQEHPDTLQEAWVATNTGRMESLSFVAPQAFGLELLMFWTDKSKIVTFGIASAFGVIAGSAAYALVSKSFRLEPSATRRHDPPHRRRDPDGLRRYRRPRLHHRAGHHRVLDTRARVDPHLRRDHRRRGGDDEIRVLAAAARAVSD
jgi:hypothetical protein